MKRTTFAGLILFLCLSLSGCQCEHEWKDANCEDPKTCRLCGETQGDPLDHIWSEISCAAPVTCHDCGKTRGEALPHTWVEASCTEPKSCQECGATEGEALGHSFGEWKESIPDLEPVRQEQIRTCSVCEYIEEQEAYLTVLHENGKFILKPSSAAYRMNLLMAKTDIGKEYQAEANQFWLLNPNGTYYGRGLFETTDYDADGNWFAYYHGYPGSQMYLMMHFANGSEMCKSYTESYDTVYFQCDFSDLGKAALQMIPMAMDPSLTMEESARMIDEVLNHPDGMLEYNGLVYSVENQGNRLHIFIRITE